MKRQTIRTVAFWTTTILGPASFVIGGVLNLSQSQQVAETMHHLGYPLYLASILGFWKLAGAIAIVAPGFPPEGVGVRRLLLRPDRRSRLACRRGRLCLRCDRAARVPRAGDGVLGAAAVQPETRVSGGTRLR
jgi:hypothetical protein